MRMHSRFLFTYNVSNLIKALRENVLCFARYQCVLFGALLWLSNETEQRGDHFTALRHLRWLGTSSLWKRAHTMTVLKSQAHGDKWPRHCI